MNEYIPDFREDFPAFTQERFSDEMVLEALGNTDMFFGSRWGAYNKFSTYRVGWFNFVAHCLLITEDAILEMENGGSPTSTRGLDSASVGDASMTNGSQIMLQLQPWEDEAASTPFGVKYLRLLKIVGAGFITVGA